MPTNQKKRARALAAETGLNYQAARRRVAEPETTLAEAPEFEAFRAALQAEFPAALRGANKNIKVFWRSVSDELGLNMNPLRASHLVVVPGSEVAEEIGFPMGGCLPLQGVYQEIVNGHFLPRLMVGSTCDPARPLDLTREKVGQFTLITRKEKQ